MSGQYNSALPDIDTGMPLKKAVRHIFWNRERLSSAYMNETDAATVLRTPSCIIGVYRKRTGCKRVQTTIRKKSCLASVWGMGDQFQKGGREKQAVAGIHRAACRIVYGLGRISGKDNKNSSIQDVRLITGRRNGESCPESCRLKLGGE